MPVFKNLVFGLHHPAPPPPPRASPAEAPSPCTPHPRQYPARLACTPSWVYWMCLQGQKSFCHLAPPIDNDTKAPPGATQSKKRSLIVRPAPRVGDQLDIQRTFSRIVSFHPVSVRYVLIMQEASFRGLVSLGIGGVGGSPVTSFRDADVQRFTSIVQSHPDAAASQVLWSLLLQY